MEDDLTDRERNQNKGSKNFGSKDTHSYLMNKNNRSNSTQQITGKNNRSKENKSKNSSVSKEEDTIKISKPRNESGSSPSKMQKLHDSNQVFQKNGDSPLHTEIIEDFNPQINQSPNDFICFTECGHNIPKKTLEAEYEKASKNTFFGKMTCIECNTQVNMNSYLTGKMFQCRSRRILDLESQFAQDMFESKFECLICNSEVMVKEGITISCIHRFCLDCFHDYIISMIQEGIVTGIKCPVDDCKYKLSFYETKGVLKEKDLQLFEELITRKYIPKSQEFMITQCLYCSALVEVIKSTKNYRCANCRREYCITCNFNHVGKSCTEYQKTIKLETLIEKIVSCPNCNQIYEMDSKGCNFLQCRCGSYFCRLCKNLLQLADHHGDHYPNGPFANCINS